MDTGERLAQRAFLLGVAVGVEQHHRHRLDVCVRHSLRKRAAVVVGGAFGLPYVETRSWGGLLVTLVVAVTGIAVSLPLGILLALALRSGFPVLRVGAVIFIEFW